MKVSSGWAKSILVVEDEPAINDIFRRVLEGEGYEVDIAVTGKMAQCIVEEKQYDLYLIDIRLPVISGKEVYQRLKEKHPKLLSRVIFTTGDVMYGDTQRFLKQAARPILLKPFTLDELKAIVRETLKEAEQ